MVKYVSLDDEDLNEPQRAFMKLIAEFNSMLKLREDAQLLKKLEAERNWWEVIASVATDYLEKLLNWIVMYSLTGNLQTVSQQITSQKK